MSFSRNNASQLRAILNLEDFRLKGISGNLLEVGFDGIFSGSRHKM